MASKVQKQVQIVARYAYKCEGVFTGLVSYKVRSSDGHNHYCTTLLHGKAVGCSCPARKPCYHMVQLEVIEQERRERTAHEAFITASNIATTPCKDDVVTPEQIEALTQDHELGLLALLNAPHVKRATIAQVDCTNVQADIMGKPLPMASVEAPVSTYERMQRAALNGPRAFSLLR